MDESPHRHPVNWTALQALESLSPPSPSLSTSLDALANLASSGEIPILFDAGGGSRPPSTMLQQRRLTNLLKPSSSMVTFHSTNTFGQPAKSRAKKVTVSASDDASHRTVRHPSSRTSDASFLSTRVSTGTSYWHNRFSAISELDASHLSVLRHLGSTTSDPDFPSESDLRASPSVPFSVSASESIVVSPEPPYPSRTVFDAFQFPITPEHSPRLSRTPPKPWSSKPISPDNQNVSPSPSKSSTSDDFNIAPSIRFRSSLLRHAFPSRSPSPRREIQGDDLQQTTRSATPFLLSYIQQDSLLVSPSSPRFAGFSSPTLADTGTASSGSGSSTHIHRTSSANVELPNILNWLRDICFELWIDQEGFRRIQPKFRLVRYTPPSPFPDMSCDNDLTHGIALFRPVKRVTSTYHYSILDSFPALRRLTLADREDKDYMSRQASLSIKENGVYVVTGMESFEDLPPSSPGNGLSHAANNFLNFGPDHAEQPKLRWRFEYMVEDRKNDSGKLIAGEKVLTPLSFSCSPGLLHPSHGKRIRLVQVLMKNMIPKISAAKLAETAATARVHTQKPVEILGSEGEDNGGTLGSNDLPRSPSILRPRSLIRTLSGHRRTRSSEPSNVPWSPNLQQPDAPGRERPASLSAAAHQTLPRAPSSEPDGREIHAPTLRSLSTRPSNPALYMGVPGSFSRQILTSEELAAILASFPNPNSTDTVACEVMALSPPSYYKHRRSHSDLNPVDELGMMVTL